MSSNVLPTLRCSEVLDALGAYALGALDLDELDAVDHHLSDCPSCPVSLAEHARTVDALTFEVQPAEPSAATKERLFASAGLTPSVLLALPEPDSIVDARNTRRRKIPAWVLPVVSVAATLLLVGVGVLAVLLARTLDQRDDATTTAELLSTYVSAGGHVVTLQAQPVSLYASYDGKGSLLTAPGKDPMVVVAGCPKSGDYLTYWVWFAKNGKRVPAGKLTVGGDGSGWITVDGNLNMADYDTIGITIQIQNDQREDVLVAPLTNQTTALVD
jgi:hypothetical protein